MTGKARPPKQAVAEEERKPEPEPPKQSVAQREEEGRLPLLVRKLDTLKRDMQFQMVFTMADEGKEVVLAEAAAGLNQALVSQCSLVTLRDTSLQVGWQKLKAILHFHLKSFLR